MAEGLPGHAEIVVVGGGVVGCSTAYHLARQGKRDVLLLERARLTSGTTWHSAAMVRQLRSTTSLTQLTKYSARLYASLEAETGQSTGWMRCGSLSVASSADRLTHIRRQASLARAHDIEVHEVGPDEIARLWPIVNTGDLLGGILSPTDGRVSPIDLCSALVRGARAGGVRIVEDTPVTGFRIERGRVTGVRTPRGEVTCDAVALCAGLWSRDVGLLAGVALPLYPCEHYALITREIEGVRPAMPILGDHDAHVYIRDEAGGLMVGCFEPDARAVDPGRLPADWAFGLLEQDWEHFEPIMRGAIRRIPALETAEARLLLNGPESFTPDSGFLLGETPEVRGLFVGCGMNSVGVASGGGAGRALAEWIVAGEATLDLWAVDVRRFGAIRNNARVVRARAVESLATHYAIGYPGREPETGRGLRLGPLHARLAALGAFFGERAGWERASWFRRDGQPADNALTFGRPAWFDRVAEEHLAARHAVAVFDQASFGKLLVQGRDAGRFLQRVCAADVAVPPGRVVYSPVLNARGGYESDLVVLPLREDAFLLVTATAQPTHDRDVLARQIGPDEFVTVADVTSGLAVISVMGPRSRDLLGRLGPADLGNEAFPYLSHREIELGGTVARAVRISYAGELGWELYLPTEAALPLYDAIWEAGQDLGLRNAGTFALGALRLEKGYCAWGHDIGPDDTPLEAGLGFTTKLRTALPFVGREALERQRREGLRRRRVILTVDDPGVILLGGEPIVADGEILGTTTSAAYGHAIGRAVAMGYVRLDGRPVEALVGQARFEVEVACRRHAATASLAAPWDPKGLRMRVDAAG